MVKKVSTEKKLKKILDFFKSTSEVYTIKELEVKLPKHCNISSMLIKDLLKKMIDENMIRQEKAGSSNLYFSFEYEDIHRLSCELEKEEIEEEELTKANKELEKEIEKYKEETEENSKRKELVKEYKEKTKEYEEIKRKKDLIEKYSPEEYENIKKSIEEKIESINKITEDIFTIEDFVCKKFNMDKNQFKEGFNIKDLEYYE